VGQARACPDGERCGADDDAGRAGFQRSSDRVEITQPAADLNRHPGGRHPFDEAGRGPAREGAVQVDHVQPRRALGHEPRGRLARVAALDRHVLAAPLRQSHAAPLEDVDRRDHVEACHAAVLAC
jgi:hypothetical protein